MLAQEKPERAQADIVDLLSLEWRVADSVAVYAEAISLAVRLDHHLFDTFYHAVALHEADAMLITADVRCCNKVRDVGRIALLENFSFGDVH